MGPVDVIRILNAIQAPYAMSTPVVECVEDALQSATLDEASSRIADIVDQRERLMSAMSSFGFVESVWPSAANFFLIRVENSDAVLREARNRGILLRDFGGSLPNCIRITVGGRSDNDQLLALFAGMERSTA
jgi:histidinol-phosphate/aromatic aminotransferase/cobyric acid decarboxylase-like protein